MTLGSYLITDFTWIRGWLICGYVASDGDKRAVRVPWTDKSEFAERLAILFAMESRPDVTEVRCDHANVVADLMNRRSRSSDVLRRRILRLLADRRIVGCKGSGSPAHAYVRSLRAVAHTLPVYPLAKIREQELAYEAIAAKGDQ